MKLIILYSLLATSTLVFAADDTSSSSTAAAAPTACNQGAGNAHDQLISLSKIIDPSGRLSKMIADFHPAHRNTDEGKDKATVASLIAEPVKRSTENEQKLTTTTTTSATTSTTAAAEVPSTSATTTASTATTAAAAASTTTAPEVNPQALSTTTAPAPASGAAATTTQAPKPTEGGNVTVNVFLQLAPDAKTEEIVSTNIKIIILSRDEKSFD